MFLYTDKCQDVINVKIWQKYELFSFLQIINIDYVPFIITVLHLENYILTNLLSLPTSPRVILTWSVFTPKCGKPTGQERV